MRETIKVPCEPKTAFIKAMWKSIVSCEVRDRSLDLAFCEAKIVFDCKSISALHRAKPRMSREAKAIAFCAYSEATATSLISSALLDSTRLAASGKTKALNAQIASSREANSTLCRIQSRLSREVKAKALLCAKSVADSASLPLIALSAKKVLSRGASTKAISAKDLSRVVKNEAPLSANSEAILVSLTGRTLRNRAKLAFKGRAKTVASSCDATLSSETILASPITKKKALKAKLRVSQPKRLTFSFPESPCWISWIQVTQTYGII